MKISGDIINADALMRELRRLGPKARATARRAIGATGKVAVKTLRDAADNAGFGERSTGATRRSIGLKRLRNNEITVGIRKDFTDRKTGKRPSTYAWKVHKDNPWFKRSWDSQKDSVAGSVLQSLRREIEKAKAT